jgi:nitrous oxidase accessory protein NosD
MINRAFSGNKVFISHLELTANSFLEVETPKLSGKVDNALVVKLASVAKNADIQANYTKVLEHYGPVGLRIVTANTSNSSVLLIGEEGKYLTSFDLPRYSATGELQYVSAYTKQAMDGGIKASENMTGARLNTDDIHTGINLFVRNSTDLGTEMESTPSKTGGVSGAKE